MFIYNIYSSLFIIVYIVCIIIYLRGWGVLGQTRCESVLNVWNIVAHGVSRCLSASDVSQLLLFDL